MLTGKSSFNIRNSVKANYRSARENIRSKPFFSKRAKQKNWPLIEITVYIEVLSVLISVNQCSISGGQ